MILYSISPPSGKVLVLIYENQKFYLICDVLDSIPSPWLDSNTPSLFKL